MVDWNKDIKVKAKKTLALLVGAVVLCLAVACQPTPQEKVVIGKGDVLDDLIQSTPSASANTSPTISPDADALYTKLGAPKHWNHEESAFDGKLNITADADIKLPGVSELPAATASLSEFTQENLDKIADVLGVGDAEWTEAGVQTKEQLEAVLIEKKARLAEYKAEDNPDAELIADTEESIEYTEKQYADAPYKSELQKIDFKIGEISYGKDQNGEDNTGVGFEGSTQVDGQLFYLYANNAYDRNGVNRVCAGFDSYSAVFGGIGIDTPYGVSMTKEQAEERATGIARQLTDELSLCYVTPAATNQEDVTRKWGWACVFMREINGCPTAYETAERPFSIEAENVPINYEKMIIVMDDEGMISFTWDIPMKVTSIDNADVTLLPFNDISQRAIEQISKRYADRVSENIDGNGIDWGDPGCTANIAKVELGLMRVAKANSDDYYYIPVWKYFIELEHTDEYYKRTGTEPMDESDFIDENGNTGNMNYEYSLRMDVVTFNAFDGSVIDSNLGY